MPLTFKSIRLWTLVAVIVIAVTSGTMLRAKQDSAPSAAHWPTVGAI